MIYLCFSAISYFYFHSEYLLLTGAAMEMPYPTRFKIFLSFLPNFLLFILYSMLHFHLIINWILFFVYFFITALVFYHGTQKGTAVLALSSVLIGLSFNIICRSFTAIILNVPLITMDNQTQRVSNYKAWPVIAGFILGGIVLRCMRRPGWIRHIKMIIQEGSNLSFLLRIFVVMYGYLALNLFLYYIEANDLILKLWGIAAASFVLVGHMIAMQFAARLSQLNKYSVMNRREHEAISDINKEEKKMQQKAFTDLLTGCQNRPAAEEALKRFTKQKADYCLCFLDLNRLKTVNDVFGHGAGDRYIAAVADALRDSIRSDYDLLFRYGGDEFLVLMPGIAVSVAQERMNYVNRLLQSSKNEKCLPYEMSVSFGIVHGDSGIDYKVLIHQADALMYQMKQEGRNSPVV